MQRTYHFAAQGITQAPDDVIAKLVSAGRRQCFESGAQVIHRGDPARGIWLIERGNVLACRFGLEGERTLFAVLGPGDVIGETACLTGSNQQVNAIVEGHCELVWIDLAALERLLDTEPQVTRWLLGNLASKLRVALDRVEGDQSLPAAARIAKVLAAIAAREGGDVAMRQQDLADLVGASRVTVGQVLSKLVKDGHLALGYRKITVIDPAAFALHAHQAM